jgi:hypothetical protein
MKTLRVIPILVCSWEHCVTKERDVVFFTQVRDIPIFRINRVKKKIASLVLYG